MKNKTPLALGSAALAILLASDAFAARAGDRLPLDVETLQARAAAAFEAADADGDGLVSATEFAAVDDKRDRRGGASARFDDEDFKLGDADGDGTLSVEEFEALPAAKRAARAQRKFERLDADGDGGLSASEFPSRAARLAALDADGDGQVTRREMRRRRP